MCVYFEQLSFIEFLSLSFVIFDCDKLWPKLSPIPQTLHRISCCCVCIVIEKNCLVFVKSRWFTYCSYPRPVRPWFDIKTYNTNSASRAYVHAVYSCMGLLSHRYKHACKSACNFVLSLMTADSSRWFIDFLTKHTYSPAQLLNGRLKILKNLFVESRRCMSVV
jgi:hypothetical protein